MSLKDKASKIILNNLDSDAPVGSADLLTAALASPISKPRSGVLAITQSIGLHHRVQDLEAQLASFEHAKMVVLLEPKSVLQSRWKNRHELSFSTSEFLELKAQIEIAGGNSVPIKVRRAGKGIDGQEQHEIVYGRRRLRACLELGLPVSAVVEDLGEKETFAQMDRENRDRADLSAWEQGSMYKDALDQGLFSSQRRMAEALGIDSSNLSKAVRLASLPPEVIEAFSSPLDIQWRWGVALADAMDSEPAKLLAAAERVRALIPRPLSKDVFAQLMQNAPTAPPIAKEFRSAAGSVAASWTKDKRGSVSLKIRPGAMSIVQEKKFLEFLERFFV